MLRVIPWQWGIAVAGSATISPNWVRYANARQARVYRPRVRWLFWVTAGETESDDPETDTEDF